VLNRKAHFIFFQTLPLFLKKATDVLRIENSFDLAMYLLHEAKVAVVPGSSFGLEGYLRLSYSTSMENLREGISRIKEVLMKLH
jgi:aspartate aminotransferase